jgi:hypothetical protein
MAHKDIYTVLATRFRNESDLTISMMKRAISDLGIVNPEALDIIYESVMFYTGDWPETQGWGSSDSRICVNSVKETLLACEYLVTVAR